MSSEFLEANGLQLAYDEFGDSGDPAILLIMGLGTQMIAWPEEFCQGLAELGFRVVRFDNRDIGLSQKFDGISAPGMVKLLAWSRLGLPLKVPYKLMDMADDAVGVLDALGIVRAHIVGASMGGMIAQLMASYHPQRVLSLTSIMSTSGCRKLPGPSRQVAMQMIRRPRTKSETALLDHSLRTWRLIGSPGYQPSDQQLREKLTRSYRRSHYPAGYARQAAAIVASGDRIKVLKKITTPTLVIHGQDDALVPVEGGVHTAELVPNARLELFEGMGHDLPVPLLPEFVSLIGDHATAAS